MKQAAAPGGVTSHPSHPLDPPMYLADRQTQTDITDAQKQTYRQTDIHVLTTILRWRRSTTAAE